MRQFILGATAMLLMGAAFNKVTTCLTDQAKVTNVFISRVDFADGGWDYTVTINGVRPESSTLPDGGVAVAVKSMPPALCALGAGAKNTVDNFFAGPALVCLRANDQSEQ